MSLRVLFVDDEPLVLKGLCRNCAYDFDVTTAYSAAEAQEILAGRGRFDVVVSDIHMPGGSGFAVLESTIQSSPYTRFVFLSGTTDEGELSRARGDDRVTAILQKPIHSEDLISAILEASTRHDGLNGDAACAP